MNLINVIKNNPRFNESKYKLKIIPNNQFVIMKNTQKNMRWVKFIMPRLQRFMTMDVSLNWKMGWKV